MMKVLRLKLQVDNSSVRAGAILLLYTVFLLREAKDSDKRSIHVPFLEF